MAIRGIVATPGVLGGVERLADSRIPAEAIAVLDADGYSAEDIADMYPTVTPDDIEVCRAWYRARRNDVPY